MKTYTDHELQQFNRQRLSVMQYADNWKQRATGGTYQDYIATLSPISAERNLFEAVERKASMYGLQSVASSIKPVTKPIKSSSRTTKPHANQSKPVTAKPSKPGMTAAQTQEQTDLTKKYMAHGYPWGEAAKMAASPNYKQKLSLIHI